MKNNEPLHSPAVFGPIPNPIYPIKAVEPPQLIREDRFRRQYRELSADEKAEIGTVKAIAELLDTHLEHVLRRPGFANQREIALARTKLEEAVMWGVKGMSA